MRQLIGTWQGTGIATYPSIETTRYRESLIFETHGDDPILKVEQKTWRIHPDKSESLLFWECGFLRQLSKTECEYINAQNNGRAEVLRGTLKITDSTFHLVLHSNEFLNNSKMLNSNRNIQIMDKTLTYQMNMATMTHPSSKIYLEATLHRHNV